MTGMRALAVLLVAMAPFAGCGTARTGAVPSPSSETLVAATSPAGQTVLRTATSTPTARPTPTLTPTVPVSSPAPPPTPSPTESRSAEPASSVGPSFTPRPVQSDEAIAYATRFRKDFGLRSDAGFVKGLAKDPRAVEAYGILMLPAEQYDLDHRVGGDELDKVDAYARANADAFAGLYIDQEAGGVVVVLFTGDLTHHLAAVPSLVPERRVVVRGARTTLADLEALQQRITDERDVIRAMGGIVQSVGTMIMDNLVDLEISSADPGLPHRLAERYGADRVQVNSDGIGVAFKPLGRVVVRVVDRSGHPQVEMYVGYDPVTSINAPITDIGYDTGPDGTAIIPNLPPVRWRITAKVPIPNDGWQTLASADVDVPPGGDAHVTLVVPDAPKP
jgi:hypothetical protein